MRARIKAKLTERQGALTGAMTDPPKVTPVGEEYFTPQQVAERLKLHPDTIRALFRDETNGVIRIGNRVSMAHKKRYVIERYSASAVERLVKRLELVDPRYTEI